MYSTTWISRPTCRPGARRMAAVVLMLLCVAPGPAAAQETPRVAPSEVSLEIRAQARELFLEGNKLLKIPLFADAAEKYKQALALWPHPAFYYNLVIAQLNLVQPVEAYHNLEKAMEHGPTILGERRYQQGLRYRAQLQKQLGFVTVRCDEHDAHVRLDGQLLFTGSGRHEVVVLPGSHQIVASKTGRVPETRELVISPGERIEVEMRLRMPERVETERYMPAWAPWAGMGVGVAVVAVGGYLDWDSTQALQEHDDTFDRDCPRGCTTAEAEELASWLSRADSKKRAALGLYIGGGALAVGSAILIYVNRERVVRTEVQPGAVSVTPVWSSTMAGISLSVGF
jgi:tetratricopeptide (TPR) repeat protein